LSAAASIVKRRLRFCGDDAIPLSMSDERATTGKPSKPAKTLAREQRLAANLRENLHRRKAQARILSADIPAATDADKDDESAGLPKPPPES
jgi:hypothetical protein